ncbi:hypothetical protein NPIL_14381 [Nephila pilipes]|uniref:Uncharacterized protein n=1 Tax=Nephila pilipes TaxID=299642 RepID=A0A8X6QQD3_NEPPI|nr:hypothetical protein NPIL_14381 [Nephila pilipes]
MQKESRDSFLNTVNKVPPPSSMASCIDPTKAEYCSCRREVFGVDPPPQQATSPPTVIGALECSFRVLSWFLQLIRSTPANTLRSTYCEGGILKG